MFDRCADFFDFYCAMLICLNITLDCNLAQLKFILTLQLHQILKWGHAKFALKSIRNTPTYTGERIFTIHYITCPSTVHMSTSSITLCIITLICIILDMSVSQHHAPTLQIFVLRPNKSFVLWLIKHLPLFGRLPETGKQGNDIILPVLTNTSLECYFVRNFAQSRYKGAVITWYDKSFRTHWDILHTVHINTVSLIAVLFASWQMSVFLYIQWTWYDNGHKAIPWGNYAP